MRDEKEERKKQARFIIFTICVFDLLSNDSLLGTEYVRSPLGQSLQHVLHLLVK